MARLDVRVATEVFATTFSSAGGSSTVNIKELSLGGAILHGVGFVDDHFVSIRPDLPRCGEVELQGRVLRRQDGRSAIRFCALNESTTMALWEHIKQNLNPPHESCPYCGGPLKDFMGCCQHCRQSLDFADESYLETHLRNTFVDRIKGAIDCLGLNQLQMILNVIEQEASEVKETFPVVELQGHSSVMRKLSAVVREVASSDANVLLLGEAGTEKESLARVIHRGSSRRWNPFVVANLSDLPEALRDQQLFGFKRGAFRAANEAQEGLLEAADGGSVFIDDIGVLPPSLQAKFLCFLQDGIVEKLGSRGGRWVDVRILAGATDDLFRSVERGGFFETFLSELDAANVELPPLRQREGDRVLLAENLFKDLVAKEKRQLDGFSADALEMIRTYNWPGNGEELKCCIEKGIASAKGRLIMKSDMVGAGSVLSRRSLKSMLAESEKDLVVRALEGNRFVIARAARTLMVSRPSLYALMEKHDIKRP